MSNITFWRKQWANMSVNIPSINLSPLLNNGEQKNSTEIEVSDSFLTLARNTWFPKFQKDNLKIFTIESVPTDKQADLEKGNGASGIAMTCMTRLEEGKYTGKPSIYFNKKYAFPSQKMLFYTMGHELLHASQYLYLASKKTIIENENLELLSDTMDFWAFQYEHCLGRNRSAISIERDRMIEARNILGDVVYDLNYSEFPWTENFELVEIENT